MLSDSLDRTQPWEVGRHMPCIGNPEPKSRQVGPDLAESLVVDVGWIGCEYPQPPEPLQEMRR